MSTRHLRQCAGCTRQIDVQDILCEKCFRRVRRSARDEFIKARDTYAWWPTPANREALYAARRGLVESLLQYRRGRGVETVRDRARVPEFMAAGKAKR